MTRPINPEMGTKASVNVVQEWIRQCTQSHSNCPAKESVPQLPTRVIDVGDIGDAQEPRVLVTNGQYAQYACLSYCWGGPQPSTLTKATLEELQQAIPLDSLPHSLQDAIWWTRQLRLRYLWIDSLCIIQDDEFDKAREITAMESIYRSAFITLSAAKARTCHNGFRQPSQPPGFPDSPYTWAEIFFPSPDGSGVGTLIAQPMRSYNPSHEWLHMRGWTLQESLLSSRMLTFGSWQMYWTCLDAEFVNGGSLDLFIDPPIRLNQEVFMAAGNNPLRDRASVYQLWIRIVEQYVKRRLSRWEDRLPALAGIAVPFQRTLGADEAYVLGLWLGDMPRCLAWRVSHSEATDPEEDGDHIVAAAVREPGTWSWASMRSEVFWIWSEGVPLSDDRSILPVTETRIVAHNVQPRYAVAPYGQAICAQLMLRGLIRSFDWDGDEVIFDRPENRVPLPDIKIGDPLRINEHHIALLDADFEEESVSWSKVFMDGEVWKENRDEDEEVVFNMGRGAAKANGPHRRHVVLVSVTPNAAIVLEEHGSRVAAAYRNAGAGFDSHVSHGGEIGEESKFIRLGLLDFAFVDGINWAQNIADFFAGCEIRTLAIV